MINPDSIPPTQYLIMEVLAARYRLGDYAVVLPATVGGSITKLAARGYVDYESGIIDHTLLVWLTDEGLKECGLSDSPPLDQPAPWEQVDTLTSQPSLDLLEPESRGFLEGLAWLVDRRRDRKGLR